MFQWVREKESVMNQAERVLKADDNGYQGESTRYPLPHMIPGGEYEMYNVPSSSEAGVEWIVLRCRDSGRFICGCPGSTSRGYCRHKDGALKQFHEDGRKKYPDVTYDLSHGSGNSLVTVRRYTLEGISSDLDYAKKMQAKVNETVVGFESDDMVVWEADRPLPHLHTLRAAVHEDKWRDDLFGFEVGNEGGTRISRFIDREELVSLRDQINVFLKEEVPVTEEAVSVPSPLEFPDSIPTRIIESLTLMYEVDPEMVLRVIDVTKELEAAEKEANAAALALEEKGATIDHLSRALDSIKRMDAAAAAAKSLSVELFTKARAR